MSQLIVHQLPGAWGLPSISPFCLKLDAYLRMVGVPFAAVVDPTPFKGPKGKLPWIEHEGQRIGDSGFIIEYLERRFGCDANRGLDGPSRAVAHALRRLIEENLYWTIVYDRWVVDANWQSVRDVVLGGVAAPMRRVIGPLARRSVRRQLVGHGIGLHTPDEIHSAGVKDIRALADFLGDTPYFMGETPTEIDAIAYGFLANILKAPIASPIKEEGLAHAHLVAFVDRIHAQYFA